MSRERGSGTVLVVGAAGVVMMVLTGALGLSAAVSASHRARAAADLAALAAAARLSAGADPTAACTAARSVAAANAARLIACRAVGDWSVRVQVVAPVRSALPALTGRVAVAAARAGPPPR